MFGVQGSMIKRLIFNQTGGIRPAAALKPERRVPDLVLDLPCRYGILLSQ
jgi:hypothetical protein